MTAMNPQLLSVCGSVAEATKLLVWMNEKCPMNPPMFSQKGRRVYYTPLSLTPIPHNKPGYPEGWAGYTAEVHPDMHSALEAFFKG